MNPLMSVSDERLGDLPLATVRGEIDVSNTADLGAGLRAAIDGRTLALVVDLSETTYLDSAGINLLFALAEEMRGHQQQLHLVIAAGSSIARMLALTGVDKAIATHTGRDEAIVASGGRLDV